MKRQKVIKNKSGFAVVLLVLATCLIFMVLVSLLVIRNNSKNNVEPVAVDNSSKLPYLYYIPGNTTIVKSAQIGTEGGTIKVENTGTPADGVMVNIHAGALSTPTVLSIGYNDGELAGPGAREDSTSKPSGIILELSASQNPDTTFNTSFDNYMVQITVPYEGSGDFASIAPYAVAEEDNSLRPLQLENIDKSSATFRVGTLRPIIFTWFYI